LLDERQQSDGVQMDGPADFKPREAADAREAAREHAPEALPRVPAGSHVGPNVARGAQSHRQESPAVALRALDANGSGRPRIAEARRPDASTRRAYRQIASGLAVTLFAAPGAAQRPGATAP
jgi:hypothetical protein